MPLNKLVFKPGINRDQTNYSTEGGWYACDKVRFRSGFPEKIGGWTVSNQNQYYGVCRSLFPYATSDYAPLVGVGTSSQIYVQAGSMLYDITPIRVTFTSDTTPSTDNCFATTNGSNVVTVTITSHGADNGDFVIFSGATGPMGGVPATDLNQTFEVNNATANTFTITVDTTATSTVASGGGTAIVAQFEVYAGEPSQAAGYGWGAGVWQAGGIPAVDAFGWGEQANTPVLIQPRIVFQDRLFDDLYFNYRDETGASLYGSGTGTNVFYWPYNTNFNTYASQLGKFSNATYSVSGVTVTITQPNHGLVSGTSTVIDFTPDNGTAPPDSTYVITNTGTDTFTVTVVSGSGSGFASVSYGTAVPQQVGQILVAPSGHMLALSCTAYNALAAAPDYLGAYDPLLIRWSNVDPDVGPIPYEWQPTTTNTAGDLRVSSGSRIITGFRTRQEILIFTDFSLNSLKFLQTQEVFGLEELDNNISIMGPNVVTSAANVVFWMGVDKFYIYNGRVDTLPCTLRQFIFQDINTSLSDFFFSGVNAQFNEVVWMYASAAASEIDRYVIYNYQEQIWYYGNMNRTAWTDAGYIVQPIAAGNGWIYNHETGVNAQEEWGGAAQPIEAYIQSADMDIDPAGYPFMLLRRMIPDVNFTGSQTVDPNTGATWTPQANVTIGVRNFPGAASATTNALGDSLERGVVTTSATIDQYTQQVFLRARGRQINFKIGSDNLGTQWQLGMPRLEAREDGRRGGPWG